MTTLAFRRGLRLQPAAEPNVIPFIDVLLVLLIIFMVTAPRPTTDLNVNLPGPNPRYVADLPQTIVSVRAQDGGAAIYVGERHVSQDDLPAAVTAAVLASDPRLTAADAASARIYVRADLDIAYQSVIAVMDELKSAHFSAVSIVAQNADSPA